jgi:hypothetical protein
LRILFVAMGNSVHTARWIRQLRGLGWDLHLFPTESVGLHPELSDVNVHEFLYSKRRGTNDSVRFSGAWPLPRGAYLARSAIRRWLPAWDDRARLLARAIRKLKPDLVHSMEFQHSAYLTLAARDHVTPNEFPAWLVSNWGSDIYLFGRLSEHIDRIKSVLAACDFYACECHRDVGLAREFGFAGEVMTVQPNGGGFDVERMRRLRSPGQTSTRRCIALKGYQNWVGRALFGLRAIELCADVLRDYRVAIYLAEPDVILAARLFTQRTGIPVDLIEPGAPHEEILKMHGRTRVSIGLSISDAISTSALEAMIMGSFPIQSDTSCLNEWLRDGETGMLVHPEDTEQIAAAIRRAVGDDELVDRAAEANAQLAAERLEVSVTQRQTIQLYETIAERRAVTKRPESD